ncbi:MAG TPA: phospho-sugar mutase [Turneriella sp.]|nr:phospho-sugar mutase [Turneriella sp.]HNE19593.1 phospho-sugar mutase [Turneriella sp.]HNJ66535.1 phospho-sugar mutase [Turneriella sp.]HNN01625.1 phospho-sugar mutase [Turneriella sp.]
MSLTPEQYYQKFLQSPLTAAEKDDLEKNKAQLISERAFDGEPAFGTGGMRAITGLGTNRLNVQNIGRLNLAVAEYFKKTKSSPLLAMGYDSRLTSPQFSRLSYHILTQNGLRVKIFRRPTPTPLLSFAVRELGADCGVVLTASHNPPQYNGYKAYGADGGQIISPVDKDIQNLFLATGFDRLPANLHELAEKPIPEADLIEEETYQAYIARLKKEVFYQNKPKHARILYSPLHGTGGWLFERAFKELGYNTFSVLAEQAQPDGNFPTVKSPNPEEPAAFERLLAAANGATEMPDLLVATDPDADRVGAMLKTATGYHFLTGNQIGSLLLESIARKKTKSLAKPYICKTIVTTELQRLIADGYGIKTVETLTGFKYIAEQVAKDPENYLFGGEESFGYLPIHWVRDKDSLSSALALAELAEDENLVQALDEIYIRHGLFHELLHSIDLSKNPALLPETLGKLADPQAFAQQVNFGREVVDILDLRKGAKEPATQTCRDLKKQLGEGDVIQFWLKDFSRLTIRPSGTEPKIKAYLSLMGKQKPTAASLEADKVALKSEAEGILKKFLTALGV